MTRVRSTVSLDDEDFCITGFCEEKYQGVYCARCRDGYGASGNSCVPCGNNPWYYILSLFVIILVILFIIYTVRNSLSEKKEEEIEVDDSEEEDGEEEEEYNYNKS